MTINLRVKNFMQGERVTQGSQGGTGIPDSAFAGEDMPGKSLNERSSTRWMPYLSIEFQPFSVMKTVGL